jgi:hypothetical protein
MRILKIQGDGADHHRLLATMVFPETELFREAYLKHVTESERSPKRDAEPLDRRSNWQEIKRQAQKNVRFGTLAGSLLLVRAIMKRDDRHEPSDRKTSWALERFWKGRTWGDGKPMRASTRTIQSSFDEMRSVSHLWAAYVAMKPRHGDRDEFRAEIQSKRWVRTFLRLAASLERFGLETQPSRTNVNKLKTLIDAKTRWAVPHQFKPIDLSKLPKLRPELDQSLNEYQHL